MQELLNSKQVGSDTLIIMNPFKQDRSVIAEATDIEVIFLMFYSQSSQKCFIK